MRRITGTHSDTAEFFDRKATVLSVKYSANQEFAERYRAVEDLIARHCPGPRGGRTCFDVGCGPGILTARIAATGMNVVGIDFSEAMLHEARVRADRAGLSQKISLVRSSLPLDDCRAVQHRGQVDLIVCSSVLEYLDEWQPVIRQFSDLLRPGGIAIITLPNHRSGYRLLERGIKRTPLVGYTYLQHQKHQVPLEELESELRRRQLRVLETRYFALPREFLTHFLGKRRPSWIATMIGVVMQRSPV